VFDTWEPSCAYPSFPLPCSTSPKRDGRLWRFDGNKAVLLRSSAGALTPLAVDAGRVLVDHQDGSLEVLDQDGHSLSQLSYDAKHFVDAKLDGRDLVVFKTEQLLDYDANGGSPLHEWPIACRDASFADLQDGVAVYICGMSVHILWLADGKDVALPAAGDSPYVQLEAPGLFYAYEVVDADYPGRVKFVPFSALPRS
jgi:hypothetical protein